MKFKKFLQLIFICAFAMVSLTLTAVADTTDGDYAIQMEDMNCELIDVTKLEVLDESITRATKSINSDIPANKIAISDVKLPLEVGETVTINCSYSPASASMDFGVIAPDGYFYFLSVKEGSINQSIAVSQRGDYSVAIRNNYSHTVTVVGFVNY